MSDTYMDLGERLEEAYADIENDIVIDLRENNEECKALFESAYRTEKEKSHYRKTAGNRRRASHISGGTRCPAGSVPAPAQAGRYGAATDLLPWSYGCGGLSKKDWGNLIFEH